MTYYDLPEVTGYKGEGIAIFTAEQKWNEYESGAYSEEDSELPAILTQAMIEGRPIYNCTGRPIDVPILVTLTREGQLQIPQPRTIYSFGE